MTSNLPQIYSFTTIPNQESIICSTGSESNIRISQNL